MTMRKSFVAAVGVLGLMLVGCEEKKATPPPAPKAPAPKAPAAPTGTAPATPPATPAPK